MCVGWAEGGKGEERVLATIRNPKVIQRDCSVRAMEVQAGRRRRPEAVDPTATTLVALLETLLVENSAPPPNSNLPHCPSAHSGQPPSPSIPPPPPPIRTSPPTAPAAIAQLRRAESFASCIKSHCSNLEYEEERLFSGLTRSQTQKSPRAFRAIAAERPFILLLDDFASNGSAI